jgi:DNA-binding response OmpR family regulator
MPRVLVIDDDEMLRELLSLALQIEGYDVDAVEHGAAALAALDGQPADLVVVDLMMPVMDGLRFLRCLAERPSPPPVLVLSAVGEQDREQELREAGAQAIIRKPVDAGELAGVVGRMLADRRS